MNPSIEKLDKEILQELLSGLEGDLRVESSARDEVENRVRRLEEKIARVRAVITVYDNPSLADKTETGRARKGAAERLITGFLQNVNGAGATLDVISQKTATKSGTARRVLHVLRDSGKVIQLGDSWKWTAPKESSPDAETDLSKL